MPFSKQIARWSQLDQLIRLKATGPPDDLARKLKISVAALYRDINLLKDMGAPIVYCKRTKTFMYTQPGKFILGFMPESRDKR